MNKNEAKEEIEDLRIDLLTFLKMFKTDNVSKTIAEIVKKEAREDDLKKLKSITNPPQHLLDQNWNNVSLVMKDESEKVILEILL